MIRFPVVFLKDILSNWLDSKAVTRLDTAATNNEIIRLLGRVYNSSGFMLFGWNNSGVHYCVWLMRRYFLVRRLELGDSSCISLLRDSKILKTVETIESSHPHSGTKVVELLAECESLKELKLFGEASAKIILKCWKSLKSLSLSYCDNKTVSDLLKQSEMNGGNLLEFIYHNYDDGDYHLLNENILITGINCNKHLQKLSIHGETSITSHFLNKIYENNKSLTHLELEITRASVSSIWFFNCINKIPNLNIFTWEANDGRSVIQYNKSINKFYFSGNSKKEINNADFTEAVKLFFKNHHELRYLF